jgi:hypothetical protein
VPSKHPERINIRGQNWISIPPGKIKKLFRHKQCLNVFFTVEIAIVELASAVCVGGIGRRSIYSCGFDSNQSSRSLLCLASLPALSRGESELIWNGRTTFIPTAACLAHSIRANVYICERECVRLLRVWGLAIIDWRWLFIEQISGLVCDFAKAIAVCHLKPSHLRLLTASGNFILF